MHKLIKKLKNTDCDIWKVLIVTALIRAVTYLIYMVYMKYSPDHALEYSFENISKAWLRWDADAYLDIAKNGYAHYEEYGQHLYLVFLPLYPWVMRLFGLLLGNYEFAGLLVSFLSILTACLFLFIIIKEDYGREAAFAGVISLSLFPFSFFLNGIMSDSLFILLVCAFLYYLKKHRYGLVTLFGFLACLCRLQGWFLAFGIVVELWLTMIKKYEDIRGKGIPTRLGFHFEPLTSYDRNVRYFLKEKEFWRSVLRDFLIPGIKCLPMLWGIIIYLLINYKVEGNAFAFMQYQREHWTHTMGPFWNCLRDMALYIKDDPTGELSLSIWWPQIILFLLQAIFVIYCIYIKMKPSFVTIFIAFFLVTYSSTWLISGARYTLSVLPFFMGIGVFLSGHRVGKWIWYVLSAILMVTYMWRFYNYMSIM